MKESILKEFQNIPGVGVKTAVDLWNLGFRAASDLKDQDPEELYFSLCVLAGRHVDRCMLYVFRCAVYYTSNEQHDSNLLKWWNWKDG